MEREKGFTPLEMKSLTGFTVAELLVASFIITLMAAGTFLLLGNAAQFTDQRDHRGEAIAHALQTLDILKNYVSQDTDNPVYHLSGDPTAPCGAGPPNRYALLDGGGAWDHCHPLPPGTLRDELRGQRIYTVEDQDLDGDLIADYKRVTVTIRWTEPG